MYARVTLLEIDTMRTASAAAVELLRARRCSPDLRDQPGYRGVYVLPTPEGKAALMSLWETEEQAEHRPRRARYLRRHARPVRDALPLRRRAAERYEVLLADAAGRRRARLDRRERLFGIPVGALRRRSGRRSSRPRSGSSRSLAARNRVFLRLAAAQRPRAGAPAPP